MQQYIDGLLDIIEKGSQKSDRTGTGTISLFGDLNHVYYMDNGFPNLGLKYTWFKGVKYELLWFLGIFPEYYQQFGNTNIKYLVDNNISIWSNWPFEEYKKSNSYQGENLQEFEERIREDEDFAFRWGELGPVYGAQWRSWNGAYDQIRDVVKNLRENPDDRGIMVSAWNVESLEEMALRPCHSFFQFNSEPISREYRYNLYLRKMDELGISSWKFKTLKEISDEEMDKFEIPYRALSLKMYQRSCDSFLGQPFNISSYSLLLHLIAKITHHHPYKFIHTIGDAHIYLNHQDQCNQLLNRTRKEDEKDVDFFNVKNPKSYIGDYMGPKFPQISFKKRIRKLDDINIDDIQLMSYKHDGKIKAPVAV